MSLYWYGIKAGLERIEREKPQTFTEIKAILDTMPGGEMDKASDDAQAFFGGSGGDLDLAEALRDADWRFVWSEAAYHWAMKSPFGDVLTYVEGDVYRGDTQPREAS